MQQNSKRQLLFYDRDQAILKYGSNGNFLNLSSLSEYYRPVDSAGFAIKFVAEGVERYTINGQPYVVGAGNYLLLNGEKEARVAIESKQNVKGICIHISTAVIADVVSGMIAEDSPYADHELASFFYTDRFLENQYKAMHTQLGRKLQQISSSVQQNQLSVDDITKDLFFELSESLVADQTLVFKQLQSIQTVKPHTRRDLCRRIMRGKEFIDTYFKQSLTIEQIAKESAMSEYHFFRLFKKVFGVSPHQYILSQRLTAASVLLNADYAVSDVAVECGFADIYTFSKAFKKHFGVSPSLYHGVK